MVISLERDADCLHMVQLMPLHSQTPLSFASFKSTLVLPFCYRLTQVVLEKRPLNGCSSLSVVCGAGSMYLSVCPSVCLFILPPHAVAAGLLLCARWAGDIDGLKLHGPDTDRTWTKSAHVVGYELNSTTRTRTDPTEFRRKKRTCGSVRVRSDPCSGI